MRLRGVGNVMKTAPKKNAMYWAKLRNAYFSTGRLGDYDAGIGEFIGWNVDCAICGGRDCGPWGEGRRASKEVPSSMFTKKVRIDTRRLPRDTSNT